MNACAGRRKRGIGACRWFGRPILLTVILGGSFLGGSAKASQFQLDDGVTVRVDNTLKYSTVLRTGDSDAALLANPNYDDALRSFPTGHFASQRVDLLTEVDVTYQNLGFSGSAAAWYDAVYNVGNSDSSTSTFNGTSSGSKDFPQATRNIEGRYIDLLNAYTYGHFHVDGMPLTARVGRFGLIWGEGLFSSDAISNGMAPLDAIKALSVPGSQIKEITLPVAQASLSLTISPKWSVEAYTQFEWRKTRVPGADSFFELADVFDYGAQKLIVGPPKVPGGPPLAFFRSKDRPGRDLGQFGVDLHFHPNINFDLGLYALRYDDKTPQVYTTPGVGANAGRGQIGTYDLGYARNIQLYGVSASTTHGPINYGLEVSARRNMDLSAASNVVLPGTHPNFDGNPLYPVGDTLHYVANMIYVGEASKYWGGITVTGEVSGSHLLEITRNANNFSPDARHNGLASTLVVDPSYFQALPGADFDFPVTLGWNFIGQAPWASKANTGVFYGGTLSLGANLVYLNVWRTGLQYTRYFGSSSTTSSGAVATPFLGRDFVSFTVSRTF